jgi:hypothetical protein
MIRPEAAETILRWREALLGATGVLLGIGMMATSSGLSALLGLALALVGAVLGISGIRHARFDTAEEDAPGLVEVDEGQITYLSPVMGGAVALDDLVEVVFRRTAMGEAFWKLVSTEATIYIPEGARGAEQLLDALAPLPGFDGGKMIRAVRARREATVKVWSRPDHAALT